MAEIKPQIEWLDRVCDPTANISMFHHPWCIGDPADPARRRTVATDGVLMVVLNQDLGYEPAGDGYSKRLNFVIDQEYPPSIGSIEAAVLLDWTGTHQIYGNEPCEMCGGDGKCQCPMCETQHECGQCKGTGRQKVKEVRIGQIGGACIDRNILAKAAPAISGEVAVQVLDRVGSATLRLTGQGWAVWLSTLSGDCTDKGTMLTLKAR